MRLFRAAILLSVLCVTGACAHRAPQVSDLPTPDNPSFDIPKLFAWRGGDSLHLGADSACALPVAVFPKLAAQCESFGPVRDGFRTAPMPVVFIRGQEAVTPHCHVVNVSGSPVQGLVGWPVIRRYVWHLDLARNRHHFHRELPEEMRGWESLPLTGEDVARVQVPGCGECIFDSGAPYGLYLSTEEWARFLREHPEAEVGTYYGESPAANGSFSRQFARVKELRLGPWVFRNLRVCESFSPRTGPRLLGRESLSQLELCFDGPAARLYYRPAPAR